MTYLYDGTYEGLLSVIFETYRLKMPADRIMPEEEYQDSLFDKPAAVATDSEWAARVRKGIVKKCGKKAVNFLYKCFLSERADIEVLIQHFVRRAMASEHNIMEDYRDEKVLMLHKIRKQIGREVHRMHAFVRFQRSKDDIYVALINPGFNVLPLLENHFVRRYPAQQWLIYDTNRKYGLYYDMESANFITLEGSKQVRQLSSDILSFEEPSYQELWKTYFTHVNIPERRNMKLHLQHVPRRYWKYLVEKQGAC